MIKPVTPSDASVLTKLHVDSFAKSAWNLNQMEGSLALPTTVGWAFYDRGKPLGFILCQRTTDASEILTFCVHPHHQRKKIGEQLLKHALQEAQAKKQERIFLEVASDNEAACHLYKKTGFTQVGNRPQYYERPEGRADALTFELRLFASKA